MLSSFVKRVINDDILDPLTKTEKVLKHRRLNVKSLLEWFNILVIKKNKKYEKYKII